MLEKSEIVSIYFYAILSGLVQLSVPIGIQSIIGFVLGATMVTSIYVLIALVVLGVFFVGTLQINQMKIIEKIQQKIFTKYAFQFTEKIPQLDLKKMDNYYLPEKINCFFDTLNVQKGLSKLLLDIPAASIQILFGLLLLSFYHPFFIGFGVLLLMVLWAIIRLTGHKGLETSLEESYNKYAVAAWLEEMARVIKSFKFSQGTHLNLKKTDYNLIKYLKSRTAHFSVLLYQYRALVIFKVAITTAMLTLGTYLLLNQQLNIGEFIAAEIVILTVLSAIEKLIGSIDSVYDVITGLEKLATIIEGPDEVSGKSEIRPSKGVEIEMIDFSFGYTEETRVLNGINLSIPAGSMTCVTGNEGSGKSTFLKILAGGYSDYSGFLLMNQTQLSNYSLESLRRIASLFMNQQEIFSGTIWENISLGNSEITQEKITEVAKELGIHHFILTLQNGFDTQIDATGKRLSGSAIQKILLLRALSKKPRLLLMEDAWLGFEENIRENILRYILHHLNDTTVIIASNDQYLLSKCDYHVHLNNGIAQVTKIS
ncbi:MAG: ATP-binding cassette domain-containing protein [Chitinophagales bacterium]|nr:ATP-binding cassette domain-containing protein [Chitinophagales bacterium]